MVPAPEDKLKRVRPTRTLAPMTPSSAPRRWRMRASAVRNLLLNDLGIYDEAFVRDQTNGPYLVNGDGRYLREAETGKPLVWDEERRIACGYDAASTKPALLR